MEAIEFRTKIKNGNIRIPDKFKKKTDGTVKVIIISQQNTSSTDIIDKLLENPIQLENFSPFLRKEIYERL